MRWRSTARSPRTGVGFVTGNQKAQFKITFSGLRYNQETLATAQRPRQTSSAADDDTSSSDDSDTSKRRSDANETWCEPDTDVRERATFTFIRRPTLRAESGGAAQAPPLGVDDDADARQARRHPLHSAVAMAHAQAGEG